MDSGTLNNYAGIAGFVLALLTAIGGIIAFCLQRSREKAADEQHENHRREDKEQFDRQLREAKEASAAHIAVLREQNDILRRSVDADTVRALQATEELLEVSLARMQLPSGGKEVLVADIKNCSPITAEVRNIELLGDNGGLRPCWATLATASSGSGLPDQMAIANPVSFRIHKDETVRVYFAKRVPGEGGDPISGTLVAPDYYAESNFRFAFQNARAVVVHTVKSTYGSKDNAILKWFEQYMKQCYEEGHARHVNGYAMKGVNVPLGR